MEIDYNSLLSGFIGSAIGALVVVITSVASRKWQAEENQKRREHDVRIQERQHKHDKDMQRREENIKRTGIASLREVGGG